MTLHRFSISISLVLRSTLVALALFVSVLPSAATATNSGAQSYMVVMKGAYALDGTYALGQGYALVGEHTGYALSTTQLGYALGRRKNVIVCGPRVNVFQCLVDQYPGIPDLIAGVMP